MISQNPLYRSRRGDTIHTSINEAYEMKILSEAAPQPAAILEGYEAVDCEKEGGSTIDCETEGGGTRVYKTTEPLPPVPSEAGPENDIMYKTIPGESDNPD